MTNEDLDFLVCKYNVDLSNEKPVERKNGRLEASGPIYSNVHDKPVKHYLRSDVVELVNNAISHDIINLKEKLDELEDDLIK